MEVLLATACVVAIGLGAAAIWWAGTDRVEPDRRGRAFAARLATIDAYVSELERAGRLRELGMGGLPDSRAAVAAADDLDELLAAHGDGAADVLAELRTVLREMVSQARSGFRNALEWRERRSEYGLVRERLVQRVRGIGPIDLSDVLPGEPVEEPSFPRVAEPAPEPIPEPAPEPSVVLVVEVPVAEVTAEPVVEVPVAEVTAEPVVEVPAEAPTETAGEPAPEPAKPRAKAPSAKRAAKRPRKSQGRASTAKSSKRKS